MSQERIEKLQAALRASNDEWPRQYHARRSEKLVQWLETRLARAVGDSDVEFATSTVDGGRGASATKYTATILTPDFVIFGELEALDVSQQAYPVLGDVKVVHRSKIKGLTLHHVEYFDSEHHPDYVSFTADFEGFPSITVGMPSYSSQLDGRTAKTFDALKTDLAKAGKR